MNVVSLRLVVRGAGDTLAEVDSLIRGSLVNSSPVVLRQAKA